LYIMKIKNLGELSLFILIALKGIKYESTY
jgi:hypothetical protein